MEHVDVVVIGAGVVGLAVAAELSHRFESVVVIERHESFGKETSSRNSEVIHAGIYYPNGSLKARLCVEGAPLLYEFCAHHGIPHRKIGKLIIATAETEISQLESLFRKGIENGSSGLSLIDRGKALGLQPAVKANAAILSENTGIIDSHSLMKSLCYMAEENGVLMAFNSEVASVEPVPDGYIVSVVQEDMKLHTRILVNSAGLCSDRIAALAGIDIDASEYRLRYCKGSYFHYTRKSPVSMLIYPIPHADLKGLGVHATLDLAGRLRFGPDTEYADNPDYNVDPLKRRMFYEGACTIIHGLEEEHFAPDMSGIRPKIKGEGIKDFIIREESDRGLPGFINLIGIESPGLTASLSIAKYVNTLIRE